MKWACSGRVQYQKELEFQNETWVGSWNAPRPSVLGVRVANDGKFRDSGFDGMIESSGA